MDGLDTLITIQIVYIAILFFIIRATIRKGRKGIFYWIVAGLYLVTITWLVIRIYKYADRRKWWVWICYRNVLNDCSW